MPKHWVLQVCPVEQLKARGHFHASFTMVDVVSHRRQRPGEDG